MCHTCKQFGLRKTAYFDDIFLKSEVLVSLTIISHLFRTLWQKISSEISACHAKTLLALLNSYHNNHETKTVTKTRVSMQACSNPLNPFLGLKFHSNKKSNYVSSLF